MNGGIIEIFAKCPSCGVDGARIRKVKEWAAENGVSVVDYKLLGSGRQAARERYDHYLNTSGINERVAIMVYEDGTIMRLDAWKP